jgi:iron complex outermembrane recepter protein
VEIIGTTLFQGSGAHQPGARERAGRHRCLNAELPGYALVNLDARYQLNKKLMFFGRVTNLFDKGYETLGVLGANFFNGPGRTFNASPGNVTDEQFRSVGAPREFWVGVRYDFDKQRN